MILEKTKPWRPNPHDGLVVAIDPGTNTVGVSRIYVDPLTWEIKQIYAQTVTADLLCKQQFLEDPSLWNRLIELRRFFKDFFEEHDPDAVIAESPFYFSKRPGAYETLVEAKFIIKEALYATNPFITLNLITPSVAKKAVGAASDQSDKNKMRQTVLGLDVVKNSLKSNANDLDDHACDSIAVGVAYIQNCRSVLNEV